MSASFEVKTREPEAHYPEFSSAKFSRNDSGVVVGTGAGGGRWKLATIILGALSAVLLVALIVALANNGNGGDGSSDGDGGNAPPGFSELSPGGGLCSADAEVAIAESPSCSNGTYYFDRGSGGVEVCECFQGFVGKACEVKVPEEKVVVTARSGTSTSNMITARYWAENEMVGDGRSGLVSMVSSYRIGYNWGSEGAGWSLMGDLDTMIRDLHTKVGNAKTEGKQIVVGMTVDQLVQASIYAMARRDPNGADFFAVTGGVDAMYPLYWKDIVEYYSAKHFKWVDGEDVADYAGPGVIELALSPSQMKAAAQAAPTTSPDAMMVMDRSKYWPQFTRVVQEINAKDDVTLFSLCEATGHCGTRFAWAIVGDAKVASDMWSFVGKINMHTPRDVQLRVSTVLDIVLARMRTDTCMFRAAAAQMAARWTRLEALFASSPSGPLKLMGRPEGTTPAYATLTCDAAGTSFTPTEEDIAALLGSNGFAASASTLPMRGCGAYLLYRAGVFAHDNTDTKCAKGDFSHAFLDLTMREEDFDLLLSRLDSSIADM